MKVGRRDVGKKWDLRVEGIIVKRCVNATLQLREQEQKLADILFQLPVYIICLCQANCQMFAHSTVN